MTENSTDYEAILDAAKTSAEIVSAFKRMSDDADRLAITPSPEHVGAFDLFFFGLGGIKTSFLIFEEELLARRFMTDGLNENEAIFVVLEGAIYYIPYAKLH